MNYLYLNNTSQQPMTHSFVFSKRNEKIDWRRIAAVDVDRVARDLDFKVLQDNIEQITLCNIDMEVDTRAMDPNFTKLYKMAQLIIEYLLLCQDQITNQLFDYEQTKSKSTQDQDEFHRELQKLKDELNLTKKESKKRKKMIETQQKMLMAQHQNHHTCPVCTHSFLSFDYLQAHIHRRHPEHDPDRRREHDVDTEKEVQHLKEELRNKETELQLIKMQKAVDEEKIRERDENIRKLKDEMQAIIQKLTILEEKYFTLRSSNQNQVPSSNQPETGIKELLKENKSLRTENEQLKQSLQQAEHNFKKEEKQKRRLERQNQNLQQQINSLEENLRSLKNASGDSSRLSEELTQYRNRYNEEKNRRKQLEDQLNAANKQLAQLRNQPPPVNDRKSPVPPPRSSISPPPMPTPTRPTTRPIQTTDIFLPQFCPSVIREVNENPRFLVDFRNNAKLQFNDELQQHENLNIHESDTRLSEGDYPSKMKIVEQTRRNMQNDLPNFERIRRELSQTVDKLTHERLHTLPGSGTSNRLSGGKLVKFEDESPRHQQPSSIKKPSTTISSKPKYDYNNSSTNFRSDDEETATSESDDYYSQPTRSVTSAGIQPSPRKAVPSSGISALTDVGMRPVPINNAKTISAIVRPKSTLVNQQSESSEDESLTIPVAQPKTRFPDQKPIEINSKGQKPIISTRPKTVQPTHKTRNDDDDDDSGSSFTSVNEPNPQQKISITNVPQNSLRPLINTNTNQNLSSGDISQHTYDSLWKSPGGKGPDVRRPLTADSAKTSIMDSDDDLDEEDSK
ncbi:unnamed protein product [Rotaria socialis]